MSNTARLLAGVVLLLLITISSGCGGSDRATAYENAWGAQSGSIIPLTFAIPTSIDRKNDREDPYYAARLKEVAREIEKRNRKYYVRFVHAIDPLSKFTRQSSGKIKVDAAFLGTTELVSSMEYLLYNENILENSNVKDITDDFPDCADKYFKKFTPDELICVTKKGKLYGIPSLNLPETRRVCAFIREDLAQKYKVTNFKGWQDYEAFLDQMVKYEPNVYPMAFLANTCQLFAEENGFTIYRSDTREVYRTGDPEKKLINFNTTTEYLKVLKRLDNWAERGFAKFNSKPLSYDIKTGRFASFLGMSPAGNFIKSVMAENGKGEIKYKQVDILPNVKTARLYEHGNIVVFNKKSPNVKHAIALIDWLQKNKDTYELIMYGIEDKDYKRDNKGRPYPTKPEDRMLEDAFYNWQKKWFPYNVDNDIYVSKETKLKQERMVKQSSEYPAHHGFPESNLSIPKRNELLFDEASEYLIYPEDLVLSGRLSAREAFGKIIIPLMDDPQYIKYLAELQKKLSEWNWKD